MNEQDRQALERRARQLRRDVLQMTYEAQSGHPGGSCSLADLMAYLYFYRLRYDTASPKSPSRDRLVLSKGHAAPVLYAALGESGFFPKEEFRRLRKIGSLLQGHPCIAIPGRGRHHRLARPGAFAGDRHGDRREAPAARRQGPCDPGRRGARRGTGLGGRHGGPAVRARQPRCDHRPQPATRTTAPPRRSSRWSRWRTNGGRSAGT